MLIRCINQDFRDLKADGRPLRKVGDEWEATAERVAEINRAGYGIMAEAVQDAPEGGETDESGPEPAEGEERAAEAAEAPHRPTREELEGMTVKQLVELCVLDKVETPSKPRKDQLVDALAARYGLE
jgi:hypothetical protein